MKFRPVHLAPYLIETIRVLAALFLASLLFIWVRALWTIVPYDPALLLRWMPRLIVVLLALCATVFPYSRFRRSRRASNSHFYGTRQKALRVILILIILSALMENLFSLFIRYEPETLWRVNPERYELGDDGQRGPDRSHAKDDRVYRIICMGCSVTFGYDIARAEDTYPLVLESILQERVADPRVEVLNTGVLGYSSYQGLVQLRKDLVNYHPDLVITYFGLHEMLMPGKDGKGRKEFFQLSPACEFLLTRSRILEAFQLMHWLYLRGTRQEFDDKIAGILLHNYRENLDQMEMLGKEFQFEVFDVIPLDLRSGQIERVFPPPAWRSDRLLDVYPHFKAREKDISEYFIDNYCHLSEKGHRLMAEILADMIDEKGLIKAEKRDHVGFDEG